MTDCEYLLAILSDGRWHSIAEINRRSQRDRGHGLTIHSRVSDLRQRGYTIEQLDWRANGRRHSSYRIIPPREGDAGQSSPVSGGWVDQALPERPVMAATASDVAPMGSTGDASGTVEPAMTHDGGGIPGSAPNADALFEIPAGWEAA